MIMYTQMIARIEEEMQNTLSSSQMEQLHKARPDERKVLPRYCMYFFMTQAGRNQILSCAKTTSGLYTLSLSKIAGFMLPLAPLEEQQQFLQLVEQSDKSKFVAYQTTITQLFTSMIRSHIYDGGHCNGKYIHRTAG